MMGKNEPFSVMLGELANLLTPDQAKDLRSGANIKCPSGKRVFLTPEAAEYAMKMINTHSERNVVKQVYRCDFCNYLHLGRRGGRRRG